MVESTFDLGLNPGAQKPSICHESLIKTLHLSTIDDILTTSRFTASILGLYSERTVSARRATACETVETVQKRSHEAEGTHVGTA